MLIFDHGEVARESETVRASRWPGTHHLANCAHIKYAMLLLPGLLDFHQDTVRMPVGDRLIVTTDQAPSEPEPRTVYARYTDWPPAVFSCADMPSTIPADQLPCEIVMADRRATRPDTPVVVTESMMSAIARVLPCARGPDGVPLTPEAWASSGAFGECATWSSVLTEAGLGMEVVSASILTAVECGWSRVSKTARGEWPEPFDGYARLEVEVLC